MSTLTLSGVRKSYGSAEVIHGIDLDIKSGEFVVFVGPSGCGKSTLLRMIAGLESISGGEISIGGQVVNNVPSSKRGIAMVFQSYALYPHMSVFQNMGFGLELAGRPKEEIERRVRDAAQVLQIEPFLDRMPKALSGGQRQRVAIGRAIVRDPQVFLFDEPLSNLDASLRTQTRIEIARLHQSLGATMIYVTHDQVEAMTLADRIVILNGGRIEQIGTPLDLYHNPGNMFVAGFIASNKMNFVPVNASATQGGVVLHVPGGRSFLAPSPEALNAATLGVRPEDLVLETGGDGLFSGAVEVVEHFGEYALIHINLNDDVNLVVKQDGAPDIGPGALVSASIAKEVYHLFNEQGRSLGGYCQLGARTRSVPVDTLR